MVGMFSSHYGDKRNVPAARFGNLSMLANDGTPVLQENGQSRPSHLADLRSRSGFSGSPVYIYRIATSDLSAPDVNQLVDNPGTGYLMVGKTIKTRKDFFVGLLGVHCGQYWERIQVRKDPPEKNERVGDPIVEGDWLNIQGGMTIVAPAWSITELLDLEVFEMTRQKRLSMLDQEQEDRPLPE